MTIDPDTLASARRRIQELPPSTRSSQMELIAKLLPELDAARARGLSLDAIIPILREAGCTLTDKTIRNYVSQARRASALADSAPRAAPTPHPMTAATSRSERGSREKFAALLTPPKDDSDGLPPGHFRVIPDTPNI